MGSLFTFVIHNNVDLSTLEKDIRNIKNQLKTMPTKQEFQDALAEVTGSLDNIAADITRLTDQLQTGGLTDAEEAEVFAQLRAVADRAKAIADTTPEPEAPQG